MRRHSDNYVYGDNSQQLVLHEWDWLASALGYLHKSSDWLTSALALEKLKSFQLLPRATPVKRRDRPTIQFSNAWRHSIQSQWEALMPTPRFRPLRFALWRITTSGVHYFSNNSTARRQLFLTYFSQLMYFIWTVFVWLVFFCKCKYFMILKFAYVYGHFRFALHIISDLLFSFSFLILYL